LNDVVPTGFALAEGIATVAVLRIAVITGFIGNLDAIPAYAGTHGRSSLANKPDFDGTRGRTAVVIRYSADFELTSGIATVAGSRVAVVASFSTVVIDRTIATDLKLTGATAAVSIADIAVVTLLRGLNDAVPTGFKLAEGVTAVSIVGITIIAGLTRVLNAVAADCDVLSIKGQAVIGFCLEIGFAVGLIRSSRADKTEGRCGTVIRLDSGELH
jgi:hypothetical protein